MNFLQKPYFSYKIKLRLVCFLLLRSLWLHYLRRVFFTKPHGLASLWRMISWLILTMLLHFYLIWLFECGNLFLWLAVHNWIYEGIVLYLLWLTKLFLFQRVHIHDFRTYFSWFRLRKPYQRSWLWFIIRILTIDIIIVKGIRHSACSRFSRPFSARNDF